MLVGGRLDRLGLGDLMNTVVVLTTGGTIASTSTSTGAVASRTANELVGSLAKDVDVIVEAHDVINVNSFLMTNRDLRLVAKAVEEHSARTEVVGVVVTQGTDTMEELGYLVDLVHVGDKPVVFTGAQKLADHPDTDGPANLADSIVVAASSAARNCGALIVFAGVIFPVWGTRKAHTVAPQPFSSGDRGPIGRVDGGKVSVDARPLRPAPRAFPSKAFDSTRVDIVAVYPGADATLARAAVAAGSSGVILAGTGAGNGNHEFVAWTREAVSAGVVVGVSTRVAAGPVVPQYGNGGAVSLLGAGALSMGALPFTQARILLALLCSEGTLVSEETVAPYL